MIAVCLLYLQHFWKQASNDEIHVLSLLFIPKSATAYLSPPVLILC